MIRSFLPLVVLAAFAVADSSIALADGDGGSARLVIADPSGKFDIDFSNGQVVAVAVEGVRVSDDRLNRDGGRCVVTDEHGRTVLEIELADDGAIRWNVRSRRVTVGLTMGDVDEALASHLGIDAASAVLVTDVAAGGPAASAGLVRFDVVVAVDGEAPVTREKLAEAVASKRPGDRLVLELRRGLSRFPITIAVADEDAARPTEGNVPILGDIPVLGTLFRAREYRQLARRDFGRASELVRFASETQPNDSDRLAEVIERLGRIEARPNVSDSDRLAEVLERLGRIEETLKAREPR